MNETFPSQAGYRVISWRLCYFTHITIKDQNAQWSADFFTSLPTPGFLRKVKTQMLATDQKEPNWEKFWNDQGNSSLVIIILILVTSPVINAFILQG